MKWRQLAQEPDSHWRGYPLGAGCAAEWQWWLLGELFDRCAGQRKLLSLFTNGDQRDVANLNGHFVLWAWNTRMEQWHAWTSRSGTLHAYYADNGRERALGTFAPAVASVASQQKLDWHALMGFFTFGFFPGDRTHFKDVQVLRPAHPYVCDAAGVLLPQERYWQWRHQPDEDRSQNETVEEYGHVFQGVMDEHL